MNANISQIWESNGVRPFCFGSCKCFHDFPLKAPPRDAFKISRVGFGYRVPNTCAMNSNRVAGAIALAPDFSFNSITTFCPGTNAGHWSRRLSK
jgi:hypothetical protein